MFLDHAIDNSRSSAEHRPARTNVTRPGPRPQRLAALTGLELAALKALISPSRSKMRYLTGSSACASSGSRKRGVMCCGQFKPEQDRVLDLGFVAKRREAPRQIGVVLQLSQFRERVDLETPAVGLLHQHDRGAGAAIADACTARQPLRPQLLLRLTGT